ncbi:hypothetical protein TWF696_006639 [Orbilia brochopaga]|uniref:Phosphoglycerate mutase-like protein n=1 Tax=Orbilia brochopaga TaxID=3140254 RepID=A0AAV9UT36_9PEZI
MPPRLVHLVRHAQGQHNVGWQHHIRDPVLTATGHAQCAALAASFPHHISVTHLIVSPLKRTLQTALESFHPLIRRLATQDIEWRIRIDPIFQETGDWECDIGTAVPGLLAFLADCANDYPEIKPYAEPGLLDFTPVHMYPDWPAKQGFYSGQGVVRRARAARRYLFDSYTDDEELLIVSHGGFLHYLSEDWDSYDDAAGTAWRNTEWRSYELIEGDKGEVLLNETAESIARRGKGVVDTAGQETEVHEVEAGGHHPHSEG